MKSFKQYLSSKGFAPKTCRSYSDQVTTFIAWLQKEGLSVIKLQYSHLLILIESLQAEGRSKRFINGYLLSIRHYLDYEIESETIESNPARNLRLRGVKRGIPRDILEKEELQLLFEKYDVKDGKTLELKVITGFFIFQGLKKEELEKLKYNDIDVEKKEIKISGSKKSNARKLNLMPCQLVFIKEFLKDKPEGNVLIWPGNEMRKMLFRLKRELRKINPSVKHFIQLRSSVLTGWLKTEGLREVQYKSGHKYVSSTERYETLGLESLQSDLEKYHLLKGTSKNCF